MVRPLKVYICYPITKGDTEDNVKKAYYRAYDAMCAGLHVVLPHNWVTFHNFCRQAELALPEKRFLAQDLYDILECDALLAAEACKGSYGCELEIEWANQHGIPVYHDVDDILADKEALYANKSNQ